MNNVENFENDRRYLRKMKKKSQNDLKESRQTTSNRRKKMAKRKNEEEYIEVNMKDICFIMNNPGPVSAPITDEMFERALQELRSRKKRRKRAH